MALQARTRRLLTALLFAGLATAAFSFAGEPLWLGAAVGVFLGAAYLAMTARARAAGWIGEGGERMRLSQITCLVLGLILMVSLFYALVFLLFG